MKQLLDVLTKHVEAGGELRKTLREARSHLVAKAKTAPEVVRPLLDVLARRWPDEIAMGYLNLFNSDFDDFAGTLETAGIAEGSPHWFDPKCSVVLGSRAGGEDYFGIRWDGGAVRMVNVAHAEGESSSDDEGRSYLEGVLESEEDTLLENGISAEFLTLLTALGIDAPENVELEDDD